MRSLRMLDTTKKSDVTRLSRLDPGGGDFAEEGRGRIVAGIGNGLYRQVGAAVLGEKPPSGPPPSGAPASLVKIETGMSTLVPVDGIT